MINFVEIVQSAVITAISGIISNGIYILLFVWGVRKIAREVPSWIEKYSKMRLHQYHIEKALNGK